MLELYYTNDIEKVKALSRDRVFLVAEIGKGGLFQFPAEWYSSSAGDELFGVVVVTEADFLLAALSLLDKLKFHVEICTCPLQKDASSVEDPPSPSKFPPLVREAKSLHAHVLFFGPTKQGLGEFLTASYTRAENRKEDLPLAVWAKAGAQTAAKSIHEGVPVLSPGWWEEILRTFHSGRLVLDLTPATGPKLLACLAARIPYLGYESSTAAFKKIKTGLLVLIKSSYEKDEIASFSKAQKDAVSEAAEASQLFQVAEEEKRRNELEERKKAAKKAQAAKEKEQAAKEKEQAAKEKEQAAKEKERAKGAKRQRDDVESDSDESEKKRSRSEEGSR
jgi:hypothetical protein